ncbi:MAG: PTS glucose transporter subunit IIBC [Candidatus Riflebacteria bacterium GWC2_50_8]|nr:MAG: PTS glucose transporter subunit IIBC [Candidatus Riflebacteria bacterium GWC2_50_8]
MKKLMQSAFATLQKIGKSMMLPVSVLPVAGILLGVGSSKFSVIPQIVSKVMAQAGGAIFGNLPLICALGVCLGLTNNDGVAALAGLVGYAVMVATMGVMAVFYGYPTRSVMGMQSIDTGVLGGILVGLIAAWLFNRYYRVQLPPYLGFFSGKRLVPILTSFAAIGLGLVLSLVWPPVGSLIGRFSRWAASEDPATAFAIYGVVERALLPFGLHHIWNAPFFFEVGEYGVAGEVIRGELHRFAAGDPTAGNMAGGYLFKMFGLPAGALAIWYTAKPEHKARIGGIMGSAALTSFLTGITEPIEFSFLFLAPLLYGVHAVMTAGAYYLCIVMGIKHGMTFSHGFIDYVLLFSKSTNGFGILYLGVLWAFLYFFVFRFVIVKFNLKTPGREDVPEVDVASVAENEFSRQLVLAFGGKSNIVSLDACITRLRMELKDTKRANPERLKQLGAVGVVDVGTGLQAIFGTRSEILKTEMEEYLAVAGNEAELEVVSTAVPERATVAAAGFPTVPVDPDARVRCEKWLIAIGGSENLLAVSACAETRLRLQLREPDWIDREELLSTGIKGVMVLEEGVVHLLTGLGAHQYAIEMKGVLASDIAGEPQNV